MKPVKVGVIGVGYLGKFHVQKYAGLAEAELVGIVDTNPAKAGEVSKQFNVPAFDSYKTLLDKVDAVSIVVPTKLHYKIAKDFLNHGVDILVEKPMTTTIKEADELIDIAKSRKCILQPYNSSYITCFYACHFLSLVGVHP